MKQGTDGKNTGWGNPHGSRVRVPCGYGYGSGFGDPDENPYPAETRTETRYRFCLAAATITHLHRTPRFAPLLTPPPHNEHSIHSRDDNDNDIDALVHVSQQHLTQPRRYVSLRLFSLTNRSPTVSTCPDDSWDDMDNCGKCLDYSYGGPRPDRELFRPWRKKSPAAIEAEQQLKEDKHPTKKHARAQKVTRPLMQTKQLSSAFRTVGWTGPIPNALRQSRTHTYCGVALLTAPSPSPTSTRQRAFVRKPQ
ncbi:hypothetical protein BU15DRAFT_59037 [Melanogaster broomeanus]|nr:hypothetical protein BU15DRAFT_59037 [Melanogaster broomeanus]